jgi:hypothetical protein
MSQLFNDVIDEEKTTPYRIENYSYEEGKGMCGWISNKRILFGNRELMTSHNIEGLPTKSKEAEFSILPQRTSISKFVKGRKYLKVRWKKQSRKMSKARITGYQIQYSTSSTFKSGSKSVKVKGYKKISRTIKGLRAKKTYYVRVRTYLNTGGKTYYSAWSPARKVKTH